MATTDETAERRATDDRRSGESDRRASRTGSQLIAAFWVADALLLGLIIFFAIVGGAAGSPALAIVAVAAAVALAIHSVLRRRREGQLSIDDRRVRERRGF